jgi:hypothetical protein
MSRWPICLAYSWSRWNKIRSRGKVREVYMIGRRGPAQAKFTTRERRELGELLGVDRSIARRPVRRRSVACE